MKSNKLYTIFLLLIASVNVAAQDSVKLSMQEVFTAIDKSYPQLQYYDAKIASIRSLVDGAKAWMPPTVSLAFDRFPYRLSLIKEMMPDNQAGMMVSVQQMIPNAAKLNAKKDYLGSLENVQRNDAEWQRNTLHFTARLYYYRRFIAENKLKTIQQYRDLLKILIQTAKDKYTYNQSDLPAIFKGEAALSELENMETMSLAQIAESNIGLNTLMSRDVNAPFAIDTLLLPVDYRADYLMVNDTSALLRNDILSMESRIRSMKFNQKWAATGSRPDFGVQISHGQMFGMPNQFSIMGMMTIPIVPWSSKMYKSDVRSMEFEIDAMRKEKSTMQLMATQMVREKITMLLYETRQLNNYDKNVVPSYKKNLESNLLAYRQNTGNFFPYTTLFRLVTCANLKNSPV